MSLSRFVALVLALVVLPPLGAVAQTVLAKKGSEVDGILTTALSSKTNQSGDTFLLDARNTFFHKSPLPAGSKIEGHVEHVSPASPTHAATMVVVMDDIVLPDGSRVPFDAKVDSIKQFEPKRHLWRDAAVIGATTVAGHVASKKTGVHGGTLGGAAAGFALVSTMKSDIVVPKGTVVRLRAQSDVMSQS